MSEASKADRPRRDLSWAGGREVLLLRTTDSTQNDLRDWAGRGAPHAAVVLADRQTRGRGRQQRSWVDPGPGNLFVSVLLHAHGVSRPAAFSPAAGLSVAECLEELDCGPVGLKWPNDLEVEGRKIGGLLLEGRWGETPRVLVGLGVNLRRPEGGWGELEGRAVALDEIAVPVSREEMLRRWLPRLERMWETFRTSGLLPFLEQWEGRSTIRGRRVRWLDAAGQSCEGIGGRLLGSGALEVHADQGGTQVIHAGDVHLLKPEEEADR